MKAFKILIFLLSASSSFSQIGVNVASPTESLDVGGNFSARKLPVSSNTNDPDLLADSNGVLYRDNDELIVYFAGVLTNDYVSPNNANVDQTTVIPSIKIIKDTRNAFDVSRSFFTAPIGGIYEITFTTSIQNTTSTTRRYKVGLVDGSTNKWLVPFLISSNYSPLNNQANTYSYKGSVILTKGQQCFFGTTGYARHIAHLGNTDVYSTFFEIKLSKNL